MRKDRRKKYYRDLQTGWMYTIEHYKGLDAQKTSLWKVKRFKGNETYAYSSEAVNPWQGFRRANRLLDKLAKKWGWERVV